ncbi:MAG TPA: prolyl oligopeptidase family serine peptidase [Pyrinomonadaceae bacterium]|jgi:prolyl oligopeptidase
MKIFDGCRRWRTALVGVVLFFVSWEVMAQKAMERGAVPKTRMEKVVDKIHGVEVADPYRWLERGDAEEVRVWTEAQNAATEAALNAVAGRAAIRQRLTQLLSTGTVGAPDPRGRRYFYTRREGQQNQPVLYVRDGLRGRDRVLIDPNTLSSDGTVALDWWYPSNDGKRLAYGTSSSGDEKSVLRILEVETGKHFPDSIMHTRAASVAWLPDASGFYYTRYPAPGSVPKEEENYHRRLFFHRIGEPTENDAEIFRPRNSTDWPVISLSRDGRWLIVTNYIGFDRNDVFIRDLSDAAGKFNTVVEGQAAVYDVTVVGDAMYVRTTEGAPRGRVFVTTTARPSRAEWRELVPESASTLNSITVVGSRIFAEYLDKASSLIRVFTREGKAVSDVRLPALGTTSSVSGEPDGDEGFFTFLSYAFAPTVYRYDLKTGATEEWARIDAPTVDARTVEVRQVWYPSKDGTRVSMFVVHRKGLKMNGDNPTVLYGYGGFNVSETPSFNPRGLYMWLERGGVFAVANLRGGAEYGEEWHKAGMLDKKQNVFDDFIAAAEHLINAKVTSSQRLAIRGGSNGGLLVAAAMVQRPELFRAVVCEVPLTDMLRYQNFLIARLWIPEYGSADDATQFKYLHAYSPYHNVRDGVKYPATFITTAESDSRVDPLHARKFAARLQAANASDHPILLYIETKAGHGAGKPLAKQIDEATNMWSFLFWQLGVKT